MAVLQLTLTLCVVIVHVVSANPGANVEEKYNLMQLVRSYGKDNDDLLILYIIH